MSALSRTVMIALFAFRGQATFMPSLLLSYCRLGHLTQCGHPKARAKLSSPPPSPSHLPSFSSATRYLRRTHHGTRPRHRPPSDHRLPPIGRGEVPVARMNVMASRLSGSIQIKPRRKRDTCCVTLHRGRVIFLVPELWLTHDNSHAIFH